MFGIMWENHDAETTYLQIGDGKATTHRHDIMMVMTWGGWNWLYHMKDGPISWVKFWGPPICQSCPSHPHMHGRHALAQVVLWCDYSATIFQIYERRNRYIWFRSPGMWMEMQWLLQLGNITTTEKQHFGCVAVWYLNHRFCQLSQQID